MGKNLVFVPECHSTNTLALQLSQKPQTAEGTLVVTDHQTAGRGQRGNVWEAQPGQNLTFSIIFKPFFLPVKDQFYLTIALSLAIRDFLLNMSLEDVFIKWPNDMLVANKKICGILIENQIQGTQLLNAVAGVGLNVNQTEFSVQTATSIKLLTGNETGLAETLELLASFIEARYLQLREKRYLSLFTEYNELLYWRNEKHIFTSNEDDFEGVIEGIDEMGRLVIRTESGTKLFQIKELAYLR